MDFCISTKDSVLENNAKFDSISFECFCPMHSSGNNNFDSQNGTEITQLYATRARIFYADMFSEDVLNNKPISNPSLALRKWH